MSIKYAFIPSHYDVYSFSCYPKREYRKYIYFSYLISAIQYPTAKIPFPIRGTAEKKSHRHPVPSDQHRSEIKKASGTYEGNKKLVMLKTHFQFPVVSALVGITSNMPELLQDQSDFYSTY